MASQFSLEELNRRTKNLSSATAPPPAAAVPAAPAMPATPFPTVADPTLLGASSQTIESRVPATVQPKSSFTLDELNSRVPGSIEENPFKVAGEAVLSGILDNLPVGVGVTTALLTSLTGPAAVALGAAAGAATLPVAEFLRRELQVPRAEDISPKLRGLFAGTELFTSAVPFAFLPGAAAKAGVQTFEKLLGSKFLAKTFNQAVESARVHPKLTAALDIKASALAAAALGGATTVAPDNKLLQLGAVVASPAIGAVPVKAAEFASKYGLSLFSKLRPAGVAADTAKRLEKAFIENGEDPAVVTAKLADAIKRGLPGTPVQVTGSRTFRQIVSSLVRVDENFAKGQAQSIEQDANKALAIARDIEDGVSPRSVAKAASAEIRKAVLESALMNKLNAARAEVRALRGQFTLNKTDIGISRARAALSAQEQQIAEQTLRDARKVEGQLYAKVPKEDTRTITNTIAAFGMLGNTRFFTGETLPPAIKDVEKFIGLLTERQLQKANTGEAVLGDPTTTARDLFNLRTSLFEDARAAASKGKARLASALTFLGKSVERDLEKSLNNPQSSAARALTTAISDVFTRSFAKFGVSKLPSGGAAIPPELLLTRAFSPGRDVGMLRVKQLNDVATFGLQVAKTTGNQEAINRATQAGEDLFTIQETFFRLFASSKIIDPNTGLFSVNRLRRFRKDFAGIIGAMPMQVRKDLTSAVKAQKLFDGLTSRVEAKQAELERSIIAKVAGVENPTVVVDRALRGPSPFTDIKRLRTVANRRGGEEAVRGLRRAIFDSVFFRAGDVQNFSAEKYLSSMFDKTQPGGISVAEVLKRTGLATTVELDRMRALMERVVEDTKTFGLTDTLDVSDSVSMITNLMAQLAGARLGTDIGRALGGQTLVAAGAVSRFFRLIVRKVPLQSRKDLLLAAIDDKQAMLDLLSKPKTAQQKWQMIKTLHSFLLAKGFIDLQDTAFGPVGSQTEAGPAQLGQGIGTP